MPMGAAWFSRHRQHIHHIGRRLTHRGLAVLIGGLALFRGQFGMIGEWIAAFLTLAQPFFFLRFFLFQFLLALLKLIVRFCQCCASFGLHGPLCYASQKIFVPVFLNAPAFRSAKQARVS